GAPDVPPGRLTAAREQRLVEAFALERILVHHQRLERAHQRLGVVLRPAARRTEEGVTLRALVGAQGEEPELALPTEAAGVSPVGGGRDVLPGEQRERHVGDLHEVPPARDAGFADCPRAYNDSGDPILLD